MGAMMGYIFDQMSMLQPSINPTTTTLVGFSLGAHTIAYAANWLTRNRTLTLPFLLGLDPAGPQFTGQPTQTRLDPTDAAFVQAIHTNSQDFGSDEAMGAVDFMVNGGGSQPGCSTESNLVGCSHERATDLFINSVAWSISKSCAWPVSNATCKPIAAHFVCLRQCESMADRRMFQCATAVRHVRL